MREAITPSSFAHWLVPEGTWVGYICLSVYLAIWRMKTQCFLGDPSPLVAKKILLVCTKKVLKLTKRMVGKFFHALVSTSTPTCL
jgi:hypothetical protein